MHDSILSAVSVATESAELHFSKVYIHRSDGVPGRDRGEVWIQEAVVRIENPQVLDQFSEFPATLSVGQLIMGETTLENEFPLPLHFTGAVELTLEVWGERRYGSFRLKGTSIALRLLGEPKYLEELPEK